MPARLQFFDLFLTEETIKAFEAVDTDTYIGEVKFENTISRTTGIANPRQIERVPAGAVFAFKLVYNVENLEELEELYNLGLRAILPVWNNENKYGSGLKSDKGLTAKGKDLVKKAIDLGIIIDLSHANPNTFDGIIDVISNEQQKGKSPIVIASHSNCRSLCDRKRNLTDEQLIKLKNG